MFSHTLSLSPEVKQTYTVTSKPKLYAKCQYMRIGNLVISKQWWRVCCSRFEQMKINYFLFWRLSKGTSILLVNRAIAYGLDCRSVIAATVFIIYIIHPFKNNIYGTITPGDRTRDEPAFTSRYGPPASNGPSTNVRAAVRACVCRPCAVRRHVR